MKAARFMLPLILLLCLLSANGLATVIDLRNVCHDGGIDGIESECPSSGFTVRALGSPLDPLPEDTVSIPNHERCFFDQIRYVPNGSGALDNQAGGFAAALFAHQIADDIACFSFPTPTFENDEENKYSSLALNVILPHKYESAIMLLIGFGVAGFVGFRSKVKSPPQKLG